MSHRPLVFVKAFYTPREVAALAHVSRATVYRWIESGRLVTLLKQRRSCVIPRSEVEQLFSPEEWFARSR